MKNILRNKSTLLIKSTIAKDDKFIFKQVLTPVTLHRLLLSSSPHFPPFLFLFFLNYVEILNLRDGFYKGGDPNYHLGGRKGGQT
jgi:hypothetical protein